MCYKEDLKEFPQTLVENLTKHSTVIDPDMRLSFCRALILLRNKNLIAPAEVHQLFFQLLKCQDKSLRTFLKDNIVNDIKNINANHKDMKLNSKLQNFMYTMLRDNHAIAVKTSLQVMIALYKKNVWRDAKTVNVMTTACFHKVTKVMVAALKFFLGSDEEEESEDEDDDLPTMMEAAMAHRVAKKTRKRDRMLENIKKAHLKKKNKEKAPSFSFSALHLVHDPQGLAEKLFKKVETLKEKFEVKLMMVELISRLIGTHDLQILNFYPYIARFLVPHQREVVKLLQFSAQASHELVPPDAVEPVLNAMVNNFVTERNSSEVMAVGLNAIRELCVRCPLVMNEDLLRDLAQYKSYKDKSVMMASKSLILLFRETHPELLARKDRGKPTEATYELKADGGRLDYGQDKVYDHVPGAEILDLNAPETELTREPEKRGKKRKYADDESSDSDSEWEEVADLDAPMEEPEEVKEMSLEERRAKAKEITTFRILTDDDFKKIDAENLRKQVAAARKMKKKRRVDQEDVNVDTFAARRELVNLKSIEMVHGRKKQSKEERVAVMKENQKNREKKGGRRKMNEFASTNNKQKAKEKNFGMLKHKIKAKKVKRSFRDKQLDLKKRLLKAIKFSNK
jgi:protein SDA1